jgi:hypothetical protein
MKGCSMKQWIELVTCLQDKKLIEHRIAPCDSYHILGSEYDMVLRYCRNDTGLDWYVMFIHIDDDFIEGPFHYKNIYEEFPEEFVFAASFFLDILVG